MITLGPLPRCENLDRCQARAHGTLLRLRFARRVPVGSLGQRPDTGPFAVAALGFRRGGSGGSSVDGSRRTFRHVR